MSNSKKKLYKIYSSCRFCKSKDFHKILNLGKLPLAGGFLKNINEIKKELLFPLELYFCSNCYLVQTNLVINRDVLFKKYYYSSSSIKTLSDHFGKFALLLNKLSNGKKDKLIVEIGSNDGVLLKHLKRLGIKSIGVDPAKNIVKPLAKEGLQVVNDYFALSTAGKIQKKYGQADTIVSSNTLAHIENMHDVFKGINILLKNEGALIFENHYLGNMLKDTQYDMIYHEHQYYYSVLALANFLKTYNMELYDAQKTSIHAGSMRFFVQKKKHGLHKISTRLKKIIIEEKRLGLDKLTTYKTFAKQVETNKKEINKLISSLKKKGKTIAGYGASGRGTIMSNYCKLDTTLLNYVIDDAPMKQNLFMPGNHLPIVSSEVLKNINRPDYVILFAWAFFKEIANKNKQYLRSGGKFIIPLPKVKIISKT